MLEFFAFKKYQKHKLQKKLGEPNVQEALSKQEESFLRHILNSDTTKSWLKFGHKRKSTEQPIPPTNQELSAVQSDKEEDSAVSQHDDFRSVLSTLNLAMEKKTAFSLSEETRALIKEFTQILKDIQSGAPLASTDLINFLQKSNNQLNDLFSSIPDFLKSLVSTLPFPIARKLDKKSGKEVGADFLKDLAKPGVITSLLRNIMTVLRTRFPAFVGSNALLSLALFVLLFGIWYSYKRGREERLKMEEGNSKEVLVKGTGPQDDVDHGVGSTIHAPKVVPESTSVAKDVNLPMSPVETNDVPLQVEK